MQGEVKESHRIGGMKLKMPHGLTSDHDDDDGGAGSGSSDDVDEEDT